MPPDTVALDLIDHDAALPGLVENWLALWRQSERLPFASPLWLLPWWRQFGTGAPRVAVLRRGNQWLGVWPLYRLVEGGQAKILPMGIGLSDETGPLLAADAPPDTAARLLTVALRPEDRHCDLVDIAAGSPLRFMTPPPGWQAAWREAEDRPVLPLGLSLDATAPAPIRRKLRMNANRAERMGGLRVVPATDASLDADLAALVRLHGARWEARGEAGVLADPRVRAFHQASAPGLLRAGVLRLRTAWVQGRVAAVIYALLSRDRIHFYLSGFDAEFAAISPGSLLLAAMMEEAIHEGRTNADFLRGGEAYKYAWGARNKPNVACTLSRGA